MKRLKTILVFAMTVLVTGVLAAQADPVSLNGPAAQLEASSVTGGFTNEAFAPKSSVSGGSSNDALCPPRRCGLRLREAVRLASHIPDLVLKEFQPWQLFYWDGYRWAHWGVYVSLNDCSRNAFTLRRAGFAARCVNIEF